MSEAGSELDRAQTELQQSETNHSAASERLGRLQQAISDYETAEVTIHRTKSDLDELRQQRQALNEKISLAEGLQQLEKEQATAVDTATKKLSTLEKTEESISGLRDSVGTLRDSLKPKQEQL